MSERIVNDPSLHGWVEENGKWVWEGGATTGHIEDGTVQGQITTWDVAKTEWTPDSSLTIDATGNATFNVSSSGAEAKFSCPVSSLAPMLSLGRAGAGTITNDAIHVFATDGDKLKVDYSGNVTANGNATFYGTVDAGGFTVNGQPISGGGGGDPLELSVGGMSLCTNSQSRGTEYKTEPVIELESAPMHGGTPAHTGVLLSAAMASGWGTGEFRVQIADNWGSYSPIIALKVGQNGCTAPDFIASSDERLKDNITTAPVGLIDSLKGREWEWKESGEKGSGVVAQELEQVLPHLVHEDDEGMKSVSYMGLCAYLIEELKDCRERLAVLESKG